MKIAYLVVAHRNPILLSREISLLQSDDADFFIHIDAKSDLDAFRRSVKSPVVFLEKRRNVHWAGFSIVQATLDLIELALQGPQLYEYFVLLGASEYPLRSREYIHRFLEEQSGFEFIDLVKLPSDLARKPLSHINKFCIESSVSFIRRGIGLITRLRVFQRDYLKGLQGLTPYGGEMWWALSRQACEYVIQFIRTHPEIVRFFRHVQVPDETFIHTILGNSKFLARIKRNLSFRDWSGGGRHPATISERHLELFEAVGPVIQEDVFGRGEALFARKFSDADSHLLDRIEAMIAMKESKGLRGVDREARDSVRA